MYCIILFFLKIIKDENFPLDPKKALTHGCEKAEKAILERAEKNGLIDRSGSCAVIALIVGIYIFFLFLYNKYIIIFC